MGISHKTKKFAKIQARYIDLINGGNEDDLLNLCEGLADLFYETRETYDDRRPQCVLRYPVTQTMLSASLGQLLRSDNPNIVAKAHDKLNAFLGIAHNHELSGLADGLKYDEILSFAADTLCYNHVASRQFHRKLTPKEANKVIGAKQRLARFMVECDETIKKASGYDGFDKYDIYETRVNSITSAHQWLTSRHAKMRREQRKVTLPNLRAVAELFGRGATARSVE